MCSVWHVTDWDLIDANMQICISPEIDIGGGEKSGDHDGAGEAQHRPGATPHSSPLPCPPSEWEYTMHIVIRHPGVAHGYTGICNEPFLASQSDFEQRRRRFEFFICYPGSVIRKRPQMGLELLNA